MGSAADLFLRNLSFVQFIEVTDCQTGIRSNSSSEMCNLTVTCLHNNDASIVSFHGDKQLKQLCSFCFDSSIMASDLKGLEKSLKKFLIRNKTA